MGKGDSSRLYPLQNNRLKCPPNRGLRTTNPDWWTLYWKTVMPTDAGVFLQNASFDCFSMNSDTIPGTYSIKRTKILSPVAPCHKFWVERVHQLLGFSLPDDRQHRVRTRRVTFVIVQVFQFHRRGFVSMVRCSSSCRGWSDFLPDMGAGSRVHIRRQGLRPQSNVYKISAFLSDLDQCPTGFGGTFSCSWTKTAPICLSKAWVSTMYLPLAPGRATIGRLQGVVFCNLQSVPYLVGKILKWLSLIFTEFWIEWAGDTSKVW